MVGFCLIKHLLNSLVQEIDNSYKKTLENNKNMSSLPLRRGLIYPLSIKTLRYKVPGIEIKGS